jgi:hypothetical protein
LYGLGNDCESGGEKIMWGQMLMQGIAMGMDVLGTEMSVEAQREAGRYNKKLLYRRAEMTEQAMERETELATERGRRLKASQYATYAKSGAVPTSGTPLLTMVEQAGDIQRDILENRRNRQIEAAGLRHQGDVALAQAKQAGYATRMAGMQRNLSRGSSMFSMGMGGGTSTPQQQQPTLLTMNTRNQNYNTLGGSYYG